MKPHRKHLTLNGATIHYLENAAPSIDSRTILFLHGWPLSALAFRPSLERLAQRYHVIAPDLPGLGRSDYVPTLRNYEAFATWVTDFVRALAISDVTVIGHSTGGGIALMLAYQNPALVRQLILLDSAGIPVQGGAAKIALQKAIDLVRQTWAEKLSVNHVPLGAASVRNALLRLVPACKILAIPRCQDLRSILPAIQTPCLLAWGEKDRTIPLAHGEEIARCMPHAQLVTVENGFHEWSALRPDTLETLIVDFVQ